MRLVKLVEQELWQREEKGLIGILPVRDAAEAAAVGTVISQGVGGDSGERSSRIQVGASEPHKLDGKNHQEVIHWHTRGVAARALHLSRGVEKPSGRVTYTVVLEGLCRFSVQELSTRGTYYTARISPLEMTKTGQGQLIVGWRVPGFVPELDDLNWIHHNAGFEKYRWVYSYELFFPFG
ncbi:hypothetical protein CsatA_000860 [Cannabis sativa]